MNIKVGTGATSEHGNFSNSAALAMTTWNAYLGTVQFQAQILGAGGQVDYENDIYFDSTWEGQEFGSGVLAVTLSYITPSINQLFETDIVFNTAYTWDSYSGALRSQGTQDFHRVAIHELGHVLGLGHPDENGQPGIAALMNSHVSDLDHLTADDIAGAQSLYRAPGQTAPPGNDNFTNAYVINLSSGTMQVAGENYYATKEAGEPDHDPGDGVGGASVWWKWTAPNNGSMTLTTQGSHFDTLMGVYTGNAVNALNALVVNDDVESGVIRYSTATFTVTAGTTYHFAVDGWKDADDPTGLAETGLIKVNLNFTPVEEDIAPTITSQPVSQSVTAWETVRFNATANGTPIPSHRWQRLPAGGAEWSDIADGGSYAGSGSSTLSILGVTTAMNGDQFRMRAHNAAGAAYSNAATLTVLPELQGATPVIWGDNANGQADVPPGLGSIIGIAGGANFTLALKSDHTIAGWGSNYRGQISIPANLTNVRQVAAGGAHGVALKADGTVVAWGDSSFGDQGLAARVPAGLTNVVSIAAGGGNSMALRADGTVVVWGWGEGSTMPSNLNNVVQISSGSNHFMALKSDGSVVVWGSEFSGATAVPSGLANVIAISAGDSHCLALQQDGTVLAWGYNNVGQCDVPADLNNVVAITAGGHFSMALKGDGNIVTWGDNSRGQRNVPIITGGAIKIAAGFYHGIALALAEPPSIITHPENVTVNVGDPAEFSVTATGTAPLSYQWRHNGITLSDGNGFAGTQSDHLTIAATATVDGGDYTVVVENAGGAVMSNAATLTIGTPPTPTTRPATQIATEGGNVTFSITLSGSGPFTYQWRHFRKPIAGATGSSLTLSNLSVEDSGYYEVLVTGPDGGVSRNVFYLHVAVRNPTLIDWGDTTTMPEISGSITFVAIGNGSYLAVKGDGTVVGWGNNTAGQTDIPEGLGDVVSIGVGNAHVVALKSDGTVIGWGNNDVGQLAIPAGLQDVVALATGPYHCIALKSDGTLVAWGQADKGQEIIPPGLKDVVAVKTGRYRSLALKSNGELTEWGDIDNGSTTYSGPTANIADIAMGDRHSVIRFHDGTVAAWGLDYAGSTSPPAGLNGVTSLASGASFTLALKSDGTVVGWGRNYEGQVAIPDNLTGVVAIAADGASSLAVLRATPPSIVTHPSSQTVTQNDYVSLSVQAVGAIPLAYQWRKNGQNIGNSIDITGAQSPALVFSTIQKEDQGYYDVVVTNHAGAVTSHAAAITVNVPPRFEQRPLSRVLLNGQPFTINAYASSAGPVTYQWKRNGQLVAGETGPTLYRPAATAADNGHYEITVTDGLTSNHTYFHLHVIDGDTTNLMVLPWGQNQYGSSGPSTIPANLNNVVEIAPGTNHALALRANGTVTAWGLNSFGGTSIPSGLDEVIAVAAGAHHSLALKADGTVISWGNYFDSPPPPPSGLRNVVAISANGNSNLALKSDGTIVAWGMESSPAGLDQVVAIAAGSGRGTALRADGTVVAWGSAANDDKPMPAGLADIVAIAGGEAHTLALRSNGTIVGWGRNDLGQATGPDGLSNVTAIAGGFVHSIALKADGTVVGWGRDNEGQATPPTGLHQVKAIASGSYYNLVLVPSSELSPAIAGQPTKRTTYIGVPVSFGATISGNTPMTYRWQRLAFSTDRWVDLSDGAEYVGTSSTTLIISNPSLMMDRDQFRIVATNAYGTAISNPATLGVLISAPTITTQPMDQTVVSGSEITLSVTASSQYEMSYQWRHNGTPISGATSSTYIIPSVGISNEGYYTVVVTNTAGSVTSHAAIVVIAQPPAITTQPAGLGIYAGQSATFSVTATSNAPLSYQWRLNDTDIPGATASTYSIPTAELSHAGDYTVLVSTVAGFVYSDPASLVVTPSSPPVIIQHPQNSYSPHGGMVTFTVGATGAPSPVCRWQVSTDAGATWNDLNDGGIYRGTTTATLTITGATTAMNGYLYRLMASNFLQANVASRSAMLTIRYPAGHGTALFPDFSGDDRPDLIWSNSVTGERALWLMNGTSFIGASTLGIFPLEWTVAATGDFNADGKPDLVWSNSVTGERALWLMNGTNLLGVSTLGIFPLEWTVAATGDFNADGKPDLVWSNSITGERALWLMDGTMFLGASTLGIFPLEWTVAATGDFNQDRKPDLVWSNSITGERALWLMDGTQFLGSSTLGIFPPEWTVEGVGDYNGDGLADLIWSNSKTGERALWMMNGTQFLSSWSLGIFPLEWTVGN
ncbi:MAG: immunoglobulin domain-containing protein [Opitutaceae bacterium]|nr:immunoglobulin domain-containing protein [Opitutaceae bacterium]